MLLILFKDLLKAQQLGLFASPTLVGPHVRKDGTLVNAHIRVVKKRPTVPLKGRITSAPRPHTPDLFATHDEPVVIGQTRDLFDAAPAPRAAQADLFAPTVQAPEIKAPEVKTPEFAPTADADVKWFGSQEKADAWIEKKKLSDTHEVVTVGRRFEIHPRAVVKEPAPAAKPKAKPELPPANGAEFGNLFHGTARAFAAFDGARAGKSGGGFNHQGKGVYLTDDRDGYASFFAEKAAVKVSQSDKSLSDEESDKLFYSGGAILDVKIDPLARILDLRKPGADAEVKSLFEHSVGNPDVAEKMQTRVRELGYDGIAFTEPNAIEGWQVKSNATTVVLYDPSKALIQAPASTTVTSSQPGINYDGVFSPSSVAPFGVSAGVTKGERIRINNEAHSLINRGGPFNDDERKTLSQYSGNGGVGDSLNEFYTDTRVAAGMWKVLHDLGLPEGATVLEPSAATGVFMHTAPDGVKVVGVELDGVSSRIARALHGADHEVNNASLERFATQDDRQFDAVIGNPPFGLRGALIKDDKPHLATAEQYFIDTALDKTKPGGVVALILPSGVMDSSTGRAFRQNIMTKGEFIGAQRMPNTAFEHAHTGVTTDVTTDVLYLRKRPDDVAMALGTLDAGQLRELGVLDDEFLAGSYFTGTGAENVLGTMTEGWRAKAGMGNDITVEGSMAGVPEAIAAFKPAPAGVGPNMEDVLAVLPEGKARDRALSAAGKKAYAEPRVGDTKVVDGVTYVLQGDPPRWNRVDDLMQKPSIADALPLAADIDRLMNGQAVDRPALEAAVTAYVEAYGVPSKNKDLMMAAGADKQLYRLVGAIKPDGSLSDVVTGSTRKQEATLDGAAQALAVEHGAFTPAELSERWGKGDADEALDHLYASKSYALLPDGNWTTTDAYLSGELWPKLDAAKAAMLNSELSSIDRTKLEQQAQQLETVIDPASIDDVDIAINQAWIPLSIISEYFTQKNLNGNKWTKDLPPVEVTYADGIYTVTGGNQYGETKLLDTYLNRTGVRKDDKATLEAMNRDFKTWALTSGHRDELEDLYNRKFRGFAERSYSEAPFEIPGLNADGLKMYQYAGLRWAMDTGKGIIAADVGLGKTARGLILAKMAKADGKAERPMIVVPKSVLANWYAEAEKWFPGSRVLTIGESYSRDEDGKLIGKQDTVAERKRKYHDMTQNDYDFILISQPAFEEVDVSPELKNNYLADDFWVQRGDKLGNAGDKRIKKVREAFEQSVAGREFQDRTDAISFEDIGVDMLIVDEGHCFPAGTLVDGKPIEQYKAGDFVKSYDHATGDLVMERVANLQIRKPTSFYRVNVSSGKSILCTGKHPFFTPHGYVFAENLVSGDTVYSLVNEPLNNEETNQNNAMPLSSTAGSVSGVQLGVRDVQGSGLEAEEQSGNRVLLFEVVPNEGDLEERSIQKENNRGIQAKCGHSCGGKSGDACRGMESGSIARGSEKNIENAQGNRAQAEASGREWQANAEVSADGAGGAWRWLEGGIYSTDKSSEDARLSNTLQAGYSESRVNDLRRSGWGIAQVAYAQGPGPEEGRLFDRVRVESVEVFEQTSDGEFGGLCPGGVVYNIEVERTHNYLAEGVLVHNSYKNLYAARNRFGETPKFLGGQGQSNRAFDMSFKTRYIRDNNDGKNVFTLTATPTKNSPLEIYSMLSYVAPEAFEKIGIRNSEDFLDRFCVFTTENILSTTGEIEESLVTSGFKNMDELREIMRRYIHRTTAEDVGLVLPSRDDRMHTVDMDDQQKAAYVDLRALAEESAKKDDATGDGHIFSIMDKMSKASMDLELLDPVAYAGHVSPKYQAAAKEITNGAQDGGQVVFSDFVASHEKIAAELVKRGIPRNQIAIINAQVANSSLKRQRIADDFNAGKIKVVIGNTATMGEGINLQVGTTDIHHLDLPWEPASIQQRNGRGLRQGNISEAVRIHTYLSKGSFDGYKYQTVASKRDWQGDLWNGGNTIANHNRPDNLAREDMLIMLAADPDEARKQFAENKSAALERQGSEKRREVAVQFTRLQGLKRSYSKLAGKGGRSAIKLAAEIEKAQNNLASSKWFTAKSLLTSDAPAVVHPDTGSGITLDTVLHLGPKSKISEGGAWVVTGVNPEDGRLRLRHYAGTRSMNVELADVGSDMTTSTLDHSVEATEMARRAEETVSSGENAITSPAQVSQLPAETVKKLYPQIQAQLKEARKAYKMPSDFQSGRVGLLGADGVPKVVTYYSDKGEDDYLLATDEHRAKVLDAYVGAERSKKFSMDWQSNGRKNSSGGSYVFRQKYDGGWDWYTNPWGEVGKKLFGSEFEAEAMRRVALSAITEGRHARSMSEAYQALKPLAQVAGYGAAKVTMPKRAIAVLYTKAKRMQYLDQVSKFATKGSDKADHQILNADLPLISSLIERASVSGHQDLAAAMVLDHWKDQPRKALEMLATVSEQQHDSRYSGTTTVVAKQAKQAIRVLVQNNPDLGALKIDELPWALKHIYPARAGTLGEALQENAA